MGSHLIHFAAFVKDERSEGGERMAYGGVIDPVHYPYSDQEYDQRVEKTLAHHRSLDRVIRVEFTEYKLVDDPVQPTVAFSREETD